MNFSSSRIVITVLFCPIFLPSTFALESVDSVLLKGMFFVSYTVWLMLIRELKLFSILFSFTVSLLFLSFGLKEFLITKPFLWFTVFISTAKLAFLLNVVFDCAKFLLVFVKVVSMLLRSPRKLFCFPGEFSRASSISRLTPTRLVLRWSLLTGLNGSISLSSFF